MERFAQQIKKEKEKEKFVMHPNDPDSPETPI